jgi:hypothetical protein
MDKVQKPTNSQCYTPSSEPFRFYFWASADCTYIISGMKNSDGCSGKQASNLLKLEEQSANSFQ